MFISRKTTTVPQIIQPFYRGDLVHQVVRLARVQQPCEAAHVAACLSLTQLFLLPPPVVVDAGLGVCDGAGGGGGGVCGVGGDRFLDAAV